MASQSEVRGLMRTLAIEDGRNMFDQRACGRAGFVYRGVGKGRGAREQRGVGARGRR